MSNPSYPLVPMPVPRPQQPPTVGLTSQTPEEPSALWRLTVRHYKVLAACGVASLLLAWVCGWLLARPLWQAEAVLMHRPVQYTAEQLVAYPSHPSLGTLAGWLKEPRFLTGVLQESGLRLSPAEFVEKHLKVDQPMMTEVMSVTLKWTDRDTAREMLDRLIQRYVEYVVAERKKAILQGARQTMVQELALCESETERLQEHIKDLENALAQNKDLTAPELDGALLARRNDLPQTESWRNTFAALEGAMIARRGELQDRIEREEHQLGVLRVRLQKEKSDYEKHAALAHAVSQMEVANFRFQYETTRLEVENAEARIKRYTDEFRRLPIRRAETMQAAAHGRADFLKKELRTLDVAMQTVHESGRPPAHRVLTGMDAREFKVESAWVDDRPAVTNRRTLTALTFLALMGLTFGLLFAYDRNHPAAGAAMGEPAAGASGPLRARVVHVAGSGNSGVTVTHVDLDRLSVRIHHWIRPEEETNGHPALTIGPNGRVEEPRQLPAPAPAADEADPLARRIHNWLGNGTDDGTRG